MCLSVKISVSNKNTPPHRGPTQIFNSSKFHYPKNTSIFHLVSLVLRQHHLFQILSSFVLLLVGGIIFYTSQCFPPTYSLSLFCMYANMMLSRLLYLCVVPLPLILKYIHLRETFSEFSFPLAGEMERWAHNLPPGNYPSISPTHQMLK